MTAMSRRLGAGGRWLASNLPLVAFCLSLLLLAYGYGVTTMKYHIFPHTLLSQAQLGLEALTKLDRTDEPPTFLRYLEPGDDARAIVQPASARAAHAYDDVLLMTGGFYHRTDLCPDVGCIAWIMTRDGKVLHSWSTDPATLFDEADFAGFSGFPGPQNIFVQGADLDPQGNLVVTFQGRNVFPYQVGLAKFAPDGRLLWKRMDHSHHWPTAGPDGRIYTPVARTRPGTGSIQGMPRPRECAQGVLYDEGVQVIAPNGTTIATFWMDEVLRRSDRRAPGYTVRDDCDPFHVNGIDLVNEAAAARLHALGITDARAGDLFVSLRSASSVVVMDSATGHIRHIIYGPMVDQHSPATLPDGDLLVFDNIGGSDEGRKLSRILRIGLAPVRFQQLFPRPGTEVEMFSLEQGAVNASADGSRALIAETLGGRVLEVDLETGKTLWTYHAVDDISAYLRAAGAEPTNRPALMKTQGAAYISLADYRRMFGKAELAQGASSGVGS